MYKRSLVRRCQVIITTIDNLNDDKINDVWSNALPEARIAHKEKRSVQYTQYMRSWPLTSTHPFLETRTDQRQQQKKGVLSAVNGMFARGQWEVNMHIYRSVVVVAVRNVIRLIRRTWSPSVFRHTIITIVTCKDRLRGSKDAVFQTDIRFTV